ncbi:MAG: hypothetical protein LBQ31_09600 [Bacteroidales bacterium]|nr:hypothetical protein [Bacteroidales bacterium]
MCQNPPTKPAPLTTFKPTAAKKDFRSIPNAPRRQPSINFCTPERHRLSSTPPPPANPLSTFVRLNATTCPLLRPQPQPSINFRTPERHRPSSTPPPPSTRPHPPKHHRPPPQLYATAAKRSQHHPARSLPTHCPRHQQQQYHVRHFCDQLVSRKFSILTSNKQVTTHLQFEAINY